MIFVVEDPDGVNGQDDDVNDAPVVIRTSDGGRVHNVVSGTVTGSVVQVAGDLVIGGIRF